jgi:hypothetical protein
MLAEPLGAVQMHPQSLSWGGINPPFYQYHQQYQLSMVTQFPSLESHPEFSAPPPHPSPTPVAACLFYPFFWYPFGCHLCHHHPEPGTVSHKPKIAPPPWLAQPLWSFIHFAYSSCYSHLRGHGKPRGLCNHCPFIAIQPETLLRPFSHTNVTL